MLIVQLLSSQRYSIAAFAKTGSNGVTVSRTPVSWSIEMTTLMKELTAVLARGSIFGFCKQTSKERRKDNAANTWCTSMGLYAESCLPPTSFNLATLFISLGWVYA